MASQPVIEKWSGKISQISIGTGEKAVTVGAQATLPFLFEEGAIPFAPRIAYEITDTQPVKVPAGAELLCVRLQGAHPEFGDRPAQELAKFTAGIAKDTGLGLIVTGCGDTRKDSIVLPACSEALKGRQCLIGPATQDNYKILTASCLADGHSIIAESPIDINIAKQLNILISDMGMPFERIVMDPTTGALGYGLEYTYSIMERARLAALSGDKALAMPFICFVGQEAVKAKEAKLSGDHGTAWEMMTAAALLEAGADILVMRDLRAIEKTSLHIKNMMAK